MGVIDALRQHEEQSRDKVVETLRFYANEDNYNKSAVNIECPIETDMGEHAKQALKMMGETV